MSWRISLGRWARLSRGSRSAASADRDRRDGLGPGIVEAAPGDDLIGAHERERGLVELACRAGRYLEEVERQPHGGRGPLEPGGRAGRYIDDVERHAHAARGSDEAVDRRWRGAEPQERPLEAEDVEQRATVVQPDVRRATARGCAGLVAVRRVRLSLRA